MKALIFAVLRPLLYPHLEFFYLKKNRPLELNPKKKGQRLSAAINTKLGCQKGLCGLCEVYICEGKFLARRGHLSKEWELKEACMPIKTCQAFTLGDKILIQNH